MKQIRLVGVWLMCLMLGLSVTSCLKGEDNNMVTITSLVRAEGTSFYDNAGLELVPSNPQKALTGQMVYIQFKYDRTLVKEGIKKLPIELHGMSAPFAIQTATLAESATVGNAPVYSFNGGRTEAAQLSYLFWNKNIVVFPTTILHSGKTMEEATADAERHTYKLVFDKQAGFADGVLTLRFCHSVNDAQGEEVTRVVPGNVNHAFDLSNVFAALPGAVKKIKLVVDENHQDDKMAEAQVKTYEFNYPFAQ